MRSTLRATLILSAGCLWYADAQSAAIHFTKTDPHQEPLSRLLQGMTDDKDERYLVAFSDLNGDGVSEAIVQLIGRDWCGSGGCTLFVFTRTADTWKQVSRTTISHPPILILDLVRNGWRSIAVAVAGGGISPGYMAALDFDGTGYPFNPSISPARHIVQRPLGIVVIESILEAKPLF